MKYFKTAKEFYTSREWEEFRKQFIISRYNEENQMNVIDELTGLPIYNERDIVLHHIKPITQENLNDINITMNPENIMILSADSHNKIHNRFSYKSQEVEIVWGAPGSGKIEYCKKHASDRSLILSIDLLTEALSSNKRYYGNNAIKSVVFNARDSILEDIKYRSGAWDHAFIVTGTKFQGDIERMASQLGAKVTFLHKTERECLNNTQNRPGEFEKYIREWFKMNGETDYGSVFQ